MNSINDDMTVFFHILFHFVKIGVRRVRRVHVQDRKDKRCVRDTELVHGLRHAIVPTVHFLGLFGD